LLNAPVGVQRFFTRLRPAPARRSAAAYRIQRRTTDIARAITAPRTRPTADSLRSITLSGERIVSATAVGLVAIALIVSNVAATGDTGPTGNTSGGGGDSRIAVGGAVSGAAGAVAGIDGEPGATTDEVDGAVVDTGDLASTGSPDERLTIGGPFAADGTLVKPTSVDTTVADGKELMRLYRVKNGDTLTGIAQHFDVSMMTVWWANHLTSKNDLHIGQTLLIPPVSGVVVKVSASDTLDSLSLKYRVDPSDIIDANDLADPNLVVGQTLTIPGALAGGIPAPRPKPVAHPAPHPSTHRSGSGGGSSRPPAQYTGGKFHWPVAGGYISQYFHAGHYAIDIAADSGTKVMAAASGTVIFAGWKNNGGGYQVWIAHGSGLYTTYNHMSSVSVGRGQSVSRAQQVGRVGMTGNATGPHLHFEVWRGPVWDGGTRVNPLIYL
jgi:murein DD-endopeptidase MepM/ murein hydrolase activator NlpD